MLLSVTLHYTEWSR